MKSRSPIPGLSISAALTTAGPGRSMAADAAAVVRRAIRVAGIVALFVASVLITAPAHLNAATNPLATPASMVRFYFRALDSGQCLLASKFGAESSTSLRAFLRDCRTIRHATIDQLDDPGYRLHPQTAAYTCLGIRYTISRSSGTTTAGGWYLMERTLGLAWRILFPLSHITRDGSALHLTRAQCASHLPPYVHAGSGTIISGSAFLSAAAGWIALSTSSNYLPNGSCTHGIGANCDSAPTTVYRTADAGRHWMSVLHFTTSIGPPVWIRLFSPQVAFVAATVGPLKVTSNDHFTSALFTTHDAGGHWQRFPLPLNYATETGTISFPDPQHGWIWCCGGGAAGSMSVYVYRTADGGRHWRRVACTAFSNPTPGYVCSHPSGIGLGGDKGYLTFSTPQDGWLTAYENSGIPDLYHTTDGGTSWQRQLGLPPGVELPTGRMTPSTAMPFGTLYPPRFFGRIGLIPEQVGFSRAKPKASWSRLYILHSTDGGNTWPSAVHAPLTGQLDLWQAVDPRHWLFLSSPLDVRRQTLWSTVNAGASWTTHPLNLTSGLRLVGLDLTTARAGWATAQTHVEPEVSASGTVLLRTVDSGVHWSEVALP